ncbi:MAG: pyrroline-5-carboxylate reductase [Rickettsiales bacterium]|nr:pyrroline-5-carboxylate reductase [Rickettsiales bacterium]
MSDSPTLLVVGCGNMGRAMVAGWIQHGISPSHIHAVQRNAEKAQALRDSLGIHTHPSLSDIPTDLQYDMVMLAVKPYAIAEVGTDVQGMLGDSPVYVSVAAGTTLATLENAIGNAAPIVRVMPNVAAEAKASMSICIGNTQLSDSNQQFISELMGAIGKVAWLESEEQMHVATALAGSGPAYIFYLIEQMITHATELGLDEATARTLAIQTVKGAAEVAEQSGKALDDLRVSVTSPNGTTAAGLEQWMNASGTCSELVHKTLSSAKGRSIEMSEE